MSDLRQIIADETLGRLFGEYAAAARATAEPYTPVVRSGANPGAMTAYGWLMDGRPDAAQRAVDKLDADTAMRALTAATDMAIALGARLNQLRAAALPKRAAEPCGYCGRTDCEQRFDHDRLDRGHEVTAWRKWAKR